MAALVFICSIRGVAAPSYVVDWNDAKMDPEPEVPTLLYIGGGGRVTERVIGLRDWFPSLLHDMRNRMILAII